MGFARIVGAPERAIARAFHRFGKHVARNPGTTLAVSLTITFGLIGCIAKIGQNTETNSMNLYAPPDSRGIIDYESIKGFGYNARSGYLMTEVVEADANGETNALSKDNLLDFMNIYTEILETHSITYNESEYTLETLCERGGTISPRSDVCNIESILDFWNYNRTLLEQDDDIIATINNPGQTTRRGFPLSLGSNLGGISCENDSLFDRTQMQCIGDENVVAAKVLRIEWFLSNPGTADEGERDGPPEAVEWELGLLSKLQEVQYGNLLTYHYTYAWHDLELDSGFGKDLGIMAADYALMITFACFILGRNNWVASKSVLALFSVFLVAISLGAALGFGSILPGVWYNQIVPLLGFLLLGLGIDDAFVIMQADAQVDRSLDLEEQMGQVMRTAGASILVTSLSDAVAFLSGMGNSLPVIQYLCIFGSLGVFFIFMLQVTAFLSMLVFVNRRETNKKADCLCCWKPSNPDTTCCSSSKMYNPTTSSSLQTFLETTFPDLLLSPLGKVVTLLIAAGLLAASIWAAPQVEAQYQSEWFVYDSSLMHHTWSVQKANFDGGVTGFQVYTKEVDFEEPETQDAFANLISAFESQPKISKCYGWFNAFNDYADEVHGDEMVPFVGTNGTTSGQRMVIPRGKFTLWLNEFVNSLRGNSFWSSLKGLSNTTLEGSQTVCVSEPDDYQNFINNRAVMEQARSAFDNLGGYAIDAVLFQLSWPFLDGVIIMKGEMIKSMSIAGVMIFVICFFLLGDLMVALLVFAMVVLVDLNILACFFYSDMHYEFLTSTILVLSIGFSVDYSAHIAHSYLQSKGTRQERARKALAVIGRSVVAGGFTTWLSVALLKATDSYFFYRVLFNSISFVVIFGLFHGVCVLPVILSLIGPEDIDEDGVNDNDEAGKGKQTTMITEI